MHRTKLIIHADGSCRGNPGPMAIGVSIQDTGVEVSTISRVIGDGTSNVAEYRAAIEGLRRAYDLGATDIELRMDSRTRRPADRRPYLSSP